MIDKIIGLTIPKRRTRCWYWLGYNMSKGVPLDALSFWEGETPLEYGNSYKRIADAAAKDGFEFVRHFEGYDNIMVIQQHPAQICQLWSYAQILRHIADGDEITMVTWDDRYLAVPFYILNEIVYEMLNDNKREFYLFQLRIRGLELEYKPKPVNTQLLKYIYGAITASSHSPINIMESFTQLGIIGLDESIVFSPAGAAWVLEELHKVEPVDPELKDFRYMDMSEGVQRGLYMKCMNLDSWIRSSLVPIVQKKVKDDPVGIYYPISPEISFIAEGLMMGSDTQFLTENTEHEYRKFEKETELDFLNRRD